MNKYIIKNCPAWQPHEVYYCYNSGNTRICPVYKDCILKQIVELAKGYKEELIDRKQKKVVATRYFKLTKEILELLDIQEVE